MGIKSRNFPKNIGSTVLGGASGAIAAKTATATFQTISALLFEGGEKELSLQEQVLNVKARYKASHKVPLTPTINAFIGMIFILKS